MGSFHFLKLSLVCFDHGFLLASLKGRHFTFTVTPIESIEAGPVVSKSLVFVISCKPQRSIRKQNRPIFVRKQRVLFGNWRLGSSDYLAPNWLLLLKEAALRKNSNQQKFCPCLKQLNTFSYPYKVWITYWFFVHDHYEDFCGLIARWIGKQCFRHF